MIVQIDYKPDLFNHVPEPTISFELYYKSELYGYFCYQIVGEIAGAHNELLKWNHNIAKELREDFRRTINILKKIGISKIVASFNRQDKKWEKFINLFGFPKPEIVMISTMEI